MRYIVVQDFDADSTVKQSIWAFDDSPMRITKVESPYDFIETSFREARPRSWRRTPPASSSGASRPGSRPRPRSAPLTGFLVVHVDHPKQKIVKLPINGFVRPMFAVTPAAADWGDIKLNEQGRAGQPAWSRTTPPRRWR